MTSDLYVAADLDEPVSGATAVNQRVRRLLDTMFQVAAATDRQVEMKRAYLILDSVSASILGQTREVYDYVMWGSRANMPAAQAAFQSPYRLPTHIYGYQINHVASLNRDGTIVMSVPSASGRTIYVEALLA